MKIHEKQKKKKKNFGEKIELPEIVGTDIRYTRIMNIIQV
jgi:hypothetical protein